MATYNTRKQLQQASIEEIEEFFSKTVFEGIFSREIKSKQREFYKGHVYNITIDGVPTNIALTFLNVHISSRDIPEGPCTFKCKLSNIEEFKNNVTSFRLTLLGSTLAPSVHKASILDEVSGDIDESYLFDIWGVDDCKCIGYYHYDIETEQYVIDDLRKPNFDHIPYYPGDEKKRPIVITRNSPIRGITPDEYYLFTWKLTRRNKLNPFEITIDFTEQPCSIDPEWFIETLFKDRHDDKSKNFGSAANFLDTLSKQLSAKESTFVYELLQNANDYPVKGERVDVIFEITDKYLMFLHSGAYFNVRNISGICGINEKEKVANRKTIGYKGIGFKTVFLNNQYVYLHTGDYSFRFDKSEQRLNGKIKRLEAPWPILPIWTNDNELDQEVRSVISKADGKFRVQIALRPDDKNLLHVGKNSYENLFKDVFSDANIILFIPNINSVKVIVNGVEERVCYRNNSEWIVNDYEEDINLELQLLINKTIDKGTSRIPEKYKDFDCTKVSFACKHDGRKILTIKKATLYCYLPTKASWGLPFLMNTDMIPKGDRNDIESEVNLVDENETNFNVELAAVAGKKCFSWLFDLLTSRKYELDSIFSLFPDFKLCKANRDDYLGYINRFQEEFEKRLHKDKFMPVPRGLARLSDVVYDSTGLSASGIMTDEEFLKFSGFEGYYLPLGILRNGNNFNTFFSHYAADFQKFTKSSLIAMVSNDDFKKWLCVKENNNKFIEFLLENNYIDDLLDETIFIEIGGSLFKASSLYYNIDTYMKDLGAFQNRIAILSPETRDFFSNNDKWNNSVIENFRIFDCNDVINNNLLSTANKTETISKLHNKETSCHFYKFLAENVTYLEGYNTLPFINDKGEVINCFNDKLVFFYSSIGRRTSEKPWLSGVCIEYISNDYTSETKDYFKKYFGVKVFSEEYFVKNIILSETYHNLINKAIQNNSEINYDFVDYCFRNKEFIDDGKLRNYVLSADGIDGEGCWCLVENNIYFPSNTFDDYSSKSWLGSGWMYVLDGEYLKNNAPEIKEFLIKKYGVKELNDTYFYVDVVKPNYNKIFANTCGSEDKEGLKCIDFVHYLDANYNLIFEEKKDYDKFKGFYVVSDKIQDISISDTNVYLYCEELNEVRGKSWFPETTISLCHKELSGSVSLKRLGVKVYDFAKFYDDIIVPNITAINAKVTSKELSISFHQYIIDRLSLLLDTQKAKMQAAKVYLYGQDNATNTATGHKILSDKAKELSDKGLVDFSAMDIIDPAYKTEENRSYWETILGNKKFTTDDFFTWFKINEAAFNKSLNDDDEKNITYWRWLKANATDKQLQDRPKSLVLSKYSVPENATIGTYYLADEYMGNAGIEGTVRLYDDTAVFLSPRYIAEGDDISKWKEFWTKIGIKSDVIDILKNSVVDRISEVKLPNLPRLIADNRESLEKFYEDGLIAHLKNMNVIAADGNYYPISDICIVEYEREEPFPYIQLPNQVSLDTADEKRLIRDIVLEIKGNIINELSEWQQAKVDEYIKRQNENVEYIRSIHFDLINDLSAIRNSEHKSIKDIERIEEILILNRENSFVRGNELTMGSVYNPFFDFEECGITELPYVSNDYSKLTNYPGRLFRSMKVHHNFRKEDVNYLVQRKCAEYFWKDYLKKDEKASSISIAKDIIDNGLLSNIACIPTLSSMKKPCELYHGYDVEKYRKFLNDKDEKYPLESIPNVELTDGTYLLDRLPFLTKLGFDDCIQVLYNNPGMDRSKEIVEWMISQYNDSYAPSIEYYREQDVASWYNVNNVPCQIKTLYALQQGEKSLEQNLGTNPRIINRQYLPLSDNFKPACDMLGITTIRPEDLEMQPEGKRLYRERNNDLFLFALVIAGIEDYENWNEKYQNYCKKLEELRLYCCDSISFTYKEDPDISQHLTMFYHKEGTNDIYFVEDIDNKHVFNDFVDTFVKTLGIKEVQPELVSAIMDSAKRAISKVKEYNQLMLDEDFKKELCTLCPNRAHEFIGNEVHENDNNEVINRPTISQSQDPESTSEPEYDDINSNDGNSGTTDLCNDNVVGDENNNHTGHSVTGCTSPNTTTEQKPQTNSGNIGQRQNQNDSDRYTGNSNTQRHDTGKPFNALGTGQGDKTREWVEESLDNGLVQLTASEATDEEMDTIHKIAGRAKNRDEIADNHYLLRLRYGRKLKENSLMTDDDINAFVNDESTIRNIKFADGRRPVLCSAHSGILYISPKIWNAFADGKCVLFVASGKKAQDIKKIDNIEELNNFMRPVAVDIQIAGNDKHKLIADIFSSTVMKELTGDGYLMVPITQKMEATPLFNASTAKKNMDNPDLFVMGDFDF